MITHVESAEIIVRKPFEPFEVNTAPFGQAFEDEVRLKRDENGNCVYVKVGERNVSEFVNSYRNGCSLQAILERIQFMPVQDKVNYLQQDTSGVSADMSAMPTDGTEAFIMVKKLSAAHPQIFERVANGEKLDAVLGDIFKPKEEKKKVEVKENGET